MQLSEYKNIFDNEASHFYYATNHGVILALAKKFTLGNKYLKILDAGCGTGLLGKKLQALGNVQGIDISPEALKFAKKRGLKVKLASVNKLPFKNNTFDLLVSLDVIYHRQVDDKKALREFYRVLKPGGILILRVPANKWLTSSHDRAVHTRQRYSKQELAAKLNKAEFKTLKLSYVNTVLLPIAAITLLSEKLTANKARSGIKTLPKHINFLLTKLLLLDSFILKRANLPFGLGLIVVAKKPKTINSLASTIMK